MALKVAVNGTGRIGLCVMVAQEIVALLVKVRTLALPPLKIN